MNKTELEKIANELINTYFSNIITKGYVLAGIHEYTDINGNLIYFRVRLKHPELKKLIYPYHFSETDKIWILGEPEFNNAKPLYGLLNLVTSPDRLVYVVEGEQKVDILLKHGLTAVTSGGSTSAGPIDWSHLHGRKVIVWPDNDASGYLYAKEVTEKLIPLGCEVSWVKIEDLNLPIRGDVMDWLAHNPSANADNILQLPVTPPTFQPPLLEETADSSHSIIYRAASDIEMTPIHWYWKMRFAKGKISIISGDPGVGKSQLTASMAASTTHTGKWPDGFPAEIGSAIFLSAEDSPSDTIVPRLKAAGANLHKILIIDSVKKIDSSGTSREDLFDINADLPALEKMLVTHRDISVIFIDPITSYLGDIDDKSNPKIRATLAPLSKLAEKYNIAIICISHNNKNSQADPIHRVTGSIGYVAVARAVFVVVKDKEDESRRLFLPLKNNIGNDQTGLAYGMEQVDLGNEIITSKIVWEEGLIATSACDAMTSNSEPNSKYAIDEAKDFLSQILSDGPMDAINIYKEADAAKISEASIRRAKSKMQIVSKKQKDIKNGPWYWYLPDNEPKNIQG